MNRADNLTGEQLEDAFQALVTTLVGGHLSLKELRVRRGLELRQVGNGQPIANGTEVALRSPENLPGRNGHT